MTSIFRPHTRPVLTQIAIETNQFFAQSIANQHPVGQALDAAVDNTRLYTLEDVYSQAAATSDKVLYLLELLLAIQMIDIPAQLWS